MKNKNLNKLVLFSILSASIFFGCKDEPIPAPAVITPAAETFKFIKVGNEWKYTVSVAGFNDLTTTQKIVSDDGNGKYKVDQKAIYQASFIGYFPANDPKYSCIVVVSAPSNGEYYGAAVAAPIFKDIADKVYSMSLEMHKEINAVEPAYALVAPLVKPGYFSDITEVLSVLKVKEDAVKNTSHWGSTAMSSDSTMVKVISSKTEAVLEKGIIPDITGMSLQDVLFLLENKGLHVHVMGSGVVTKQSLQPGTKFIKGTTIEIELT